METPGSVRIDKWLWAVRMYHTRTLAINACHAGQVKIAGLNVKPSRVVRPGEVISALAGRVHRKVRVIALIERRVGAKHVAEFLEDLTPPEAYARAKEEAVQSRTQFHRGFGRPTKKHRRQFEKLFE